MTLQYSKDLYTVPEVSIMRINGVLMPCKHCHWKSSCVVVNGVSPTGRAHGKLWTRNHEIGFKCQDYTVPVHTR
jgi:hypothetical protein